MDRGKEPRLSELSPDKLLAFTVILELSIKQLYTDLYGFTYCTFSYRYPDARLVLEGTDCRNGFFT